MGVHLNSRVFSSPKKMIDVADDEDFNSLATCAPHRQGISAITLASYSLSRPGIGT